MFFLIAWLCFGLIICSFLGYPLVLWGLSGLKRIKEPSTACSELPCVSLIVACYNEEGVIQKKLNNTLELDYPTEKLEILVFSDGSTDDTDSLVLAYSAKGVKLVRVDGRLGKTHCQNLLSSLASGDVLVYSDANTMYSPDSIKELVASLAPADVGVVIGRRVYQKASSAGQQEGLYERMENWMKEKESLLGGTIGANGSMYAVKKRCYVSLPIDRMSDIVEPLRVATQHGLRIVFAPLAVGCEEHDNEFRMEFKRKRRIVLRAMNSLWAEKNALRSNPLLLIKLIFHKVIRWFTLPLLVAGTLAAFVSGNTLLIYFGVASVLYLICSLSLLYGVLSRQTERMPSLGRLGGLLLYSIGVFLSAAIATWDFVRGRNIRVWESRV